MSHVIKSVVLIAAVFVCQSVFAAESAGNTAASLTARGDALSSAVYAKVSELLTTSEHELFTRHLKSTAALVSDDWARCQLLIGKNDKEVIRSLEFMQKILDGLYGDAGKWESYAAGNRSLLFAFVSGYDQSLQQFHLRLPKDWDPDKAYPAIIYLHGHVPNVHPLWYSSLPFSAAKATRSDETEKLEAHFAISPWGRGNTGYRDAGETDVWEVINDSRRNFKIDADRIYLTGHSMGAFGTWQIALRTPDYWAGIAMYAGGDRSTTVDMAANLANMPVILWHGEKDRTVPASSSYAVRDLLAKVGNTATLETNPDAGHMVPGGTKTPHKQQLLTLTRKRPDSFHFTADTERHCQIWGITLSTPKAGKPLPGFDCRIEGNKVYIDSENASGLDVNAGEGGLGLTGNIELYWNGEKSYSGPASEEIELGEGGHRSYWNRRRRR